MTALWFVLGLNFYLVTSFWLSPFKGDYWSNPYAAYHVPYVPQGYLIGRATPAKGKPTSVHEKTSSASLQKKFTRAAPESPSARVAAHSARIAAQSARTAAAAAALAARTSAAAVVQLYPGREFAELTPHSIGKCQEASQSAKAAAQSAERAAEAARAAASVAEQSARAAAAAAASAVAQSYSAKDEKLPKEESIKIVKVKTLAHDQEPTTEASRDVPPTAQVSSAISHGEAGHHIPLNISVPGSFSPYSFYPPSLFGAYLAYPNFGPIAP